MRASIIDVCRCCLSATGLLTSKSKDVSNNRWVPHLDKMIHCFGELEFVAYGGFMLCDECVHIVDVSYDFKRTLQQSLISYDNYNSHGTLSTFNNIVYTICTCRCCLIVNSNVTEAAVDPECNLLIPHINKLLHTFSDLKYDENDPFMLCGVCLETLNNIYSMKCTVVKSYVVYERYMTALLRGAAPSNVRYCTLRVLLKDFRVKRVRKRLKSGTTAAATTKDDDSRPIGVGCDETYDVDDRRKPCNGFYAPNQSSHGYDTFTYGLSCEPTVAVVGSYRPELDSVSETLQYHSLDIIKRTSSDRVSLDDGDESNGCLDVADATSGVANRLESNASPDDAERKRFKQINLRVYVCNYCNQTCISPSALRIHERRHTGERPFVCQTCGKRFSQKGGLLKHEEIHARSGSVVCPHCRKTYRNQSFLDKHVLVHCADKLTCDRCGKLFKFAKTLDEHQRIYHSDEPVACTQCKATFVGPACLREHERTAHNYGDNGKCLECKYCYRVFTQTKRLKDHEILHTGERPFACTYCDKRFPLMSYLKSHEMKHTKPFKCKHCDKGSISRQALKLHEATHSNATAERRFVDDDDDDDSSSIERQTMLKCDGNDAVTSVPISSDVADGY